MSHRHRQHQGFSRSRLWALPLVLLCAVAYLGSATHFALEWHSVCLEHGETVHVSEVRAAVHLAEGEVSFEDSRIASTGQVGVESHGSDAHCAHAFFRREAPPPSTGVVLLALQRSEPEPERFEDVRLPEPVSRLRLAPKSSPPSI